MRQDPGVSLYGEIICPMCFAQLAEQAGLRPSAWRFTTETELPIPQASGDRRVWDSKAWMWREPAGGGSDECAIRCGEAFDFAWCLTHDTTFPLDASCPGPPPKENE